MVTRARVAKERAEVIQAAEVRARVVVVVVVKARATRTEEVAKARVVLRARVRARAVDQRARAAKARARPEPRRNPNPVTDPCKSSVTAIVSDTVVVSLELEADQRMNVSSMMSQAKAKVARVASTRTVGAREKVVRAIHQKARAHRARAHQAKARAKGEEAIAIVMARARA
jgi:hypothetical protein